jgi:hypothetical protein
MVRRYTLRIAAAVPDDREQRGAVADLAREAGISPQ